MNIMEQKQRPSLKMVRLGEYRFPNYFSDEMKKYGRKLISELISAKMLAVTDLDLLYDYITNIFMLNKINSEILKATNSADLKRLQTVRNGITNNLLKQSNMLGLNAKARSTGFTEVTERYDIEDTNINIDDWGE